MYPNTSLSPINSQARNVVSFGQLDLTDPQTKEAIALADVLVGCGLLKRGHTEEAARQLRSRLKRGATVTQEISPDLLAIEKAKLQLKSESNNLFRQQLKQKAEQSKMLHEREYQILRKFKEIAMRLLPISEAKALIEMAENAVNQDNQ